MRERHVRNVNNYWGEGPVRCVEKVKFQEAGTSAVGRYRPGKCRGPLQACIEVKVESMGDDHTSLGLPGGHARQL